ncbi:MAG TPA: FAD-binding oxidoreductase [Thermomicrobiales bacterium]|nr:FAD-binding oxidoreductase [Thermomicrobiales bacterium]
MSQPTATSRSVVIIGGGISGTAAAYELARRGVSVTLLERGDLASMGSGWTLAGVRQSGRHPAELPLAQAAVRRWEHLSEELDADVEYRQNGNLRLALTEDDVPAIRQVVEDGNAAGIAMSYLPDIHTIHEVAPALTHHLAGASFCPTDGHANPHLTVNAFAAAARRHGATIRTGIEVQALMTKGGTVTGVRTATGDLMTGTVIVAAGVYTPYLLDPLGIHITFDTVQVPAVQTVAVSPMLQQVLGISTGGFAGRQEASGRFRLTGFSIPWNEPWHDPENVLPTMTQVQETISWACRLIPAIRDVRMAQVWGGLIDKTPDALPVIERTPDIDGLVVAAGFSGHGFCLGPVTGEILADLATEGRTAHPITPFARQRLDTTGQREAVSLHG